MEALEMQPMKSEVVLDEFERRIAAFVEKSLYEIDRGSPESDPGVEILEFRPLKPEGSIVRLIAIDGTTEIDVELEGGARWEWVARRNQTLDEFMADILHLIEGVIRNGFRQTVWLRGAKVVRSKSFVTPDSKPSFRAFGASPLRRPLLGKTTREDRVYEPWI